MSKEKTAAQKRQEELTHKNENLWVKHKDVDAVMSFNEDYKAAINEGKTERKYIDMTVRDLEEAGFKCLSEFDKLEKGNKVYTTVEGKGLFAARIGDKDATHGIKIVGAHVDSPRLDIKPNPLYEDKDIAYFKTHYYGGIKKYQWVATPLALIGVVFLKDGTKVEIELGTKPEDPVFYITDLLPHLGREQMDRKAREVIKGEELNLIVGSTPFDNDDDLKDAYKLQVLHLLNEEYGITERDFLSAELEVVPAVEPRDVGFDRAFISAYGHDDRVCAYTAIRALIDSEGSDRIQGVFLFDKEEVGSDGVTGAQSERYRFIMNEILHKSLGRNPEVLEMQQMMSNTHLLSSDVTVAFDPTWSSVTEPLNTCYAGKGIGLAKYTGAGGKGGTSDANAEFVDKITRLFDANDVPWQIGELGAVDVGGGGTIAKFFANQGMNVLDCGVPTLSMHACYELVSKVDVYETYNAYKAFLEKLD